jgi:hypothetical protein
MAGMLLTGTLALAVLGGDWRPAVQPPSSATVFDAARARQTFYPVGRLEGDGMKMAYYVMGGQLSVRDKAQAKSAVLVNLTAEQGLVQVVELQDLSCADGRMTPTFRMMFGADGQALASSGPVPKETSETLLSTEAVRKTVDILCHGAEPKDALTGRTLDEVR